ncbi:hypothetical protein [Robbsia andropogonis]|nr:hypothetical protein [Robbsia andropogonis]MCP1121552.1 hypothetical protein [Robbsia andropogonis]MCP1131362.1 hypothetical protein [Robbsia andropogonis]
MLVRLLGKDQLAPIYVIRLWGHCQNRKAWELSLPAEGLQGICAYDGDVDAASFESAMAQSGFVARDGAVLTVVGWSDYNASLIAAWTNGGKGGRPRKQGIEDNEKTHGLPAGNPADNPQDTHGVTDKIRVDKKREEEKQKTRAPRFDAQAHLESMGVDPKVASDWLQIRKTKRAAPTETAFAGVKREADKAGLSMNDAVATCCRRSWVGFEANWLRNARASPAPAQRFDPVAHVNRNRPKVPEFEGEVIDV